MKLEKENEHNNKKKYCIRTRSEKQPQKITHLYGFMQSLTAFLLLLLLSQTPRFVCIIQTYEMNSRELKKAK